jgi:hypothetical protein
MPEKLTAINIRLNFLRNRPESSNLKTYISTASKRVYNIFDHPFTFSFNLLRSDDNKVHALIEKPGIAPLLSMSFLTEFNKYLEDDSVYNPEIKIGYGTISKYPSTPEELGIGEVYELAFGDEAVKDYALIDIATPDTRLNKEIRDLILPYMHINYWDIKFAVQKQIEWIIRLRQNQAIMDSYYANKENTKAMSFLWTLMKVGQKLDNM